MHTFFASWELQFTLRYGLKGITYEISKIVTVIAVRVDPITGYYKFLILTVGNQLRNPKLNSLFKSTR